MDAPEPQALNPADFRKVMGRFATGVTVVTARHAGETRGMTANAFMSASLDPPLCIVSVDKRAHMHAHLPKARFFAVNILAEGQEPLARHFSGKPDPGLAISFAEIDGIPTIADSVARMTAELTGAHDCGDHTLFVGRVLQMTAADKPPLLFYASRYRAIAPE
jgi:flavin reductase (DIM6/NTAB) family NADH-FMN oxidoreductase RutF